VVSQAGVRQEHDRDGPRPEDRFLRVQQLCQEWMEVIHQVLIEVSD